VTVSDASDDSRAFMREHELSFPSLRDVDGKLGDDFETTGVPESFVVDREGRIVSISRGQVSKDFVDQAIELVGSS
jgi:cytochrome c biogenesis protein CcmG, thiol:disulfide interchange protein DsbE